MSTASGEQKTRVTIGKIYFTGRVYESTHLRLSLDSRLEIVLD